MPFDVGFTSWTSGQISTDDWTGPGLEGRSELDIYRSGARRMVNYFPLPTGAAVKRPGFKWMSSKFTASSQSYLNLTPFVFAVSQTYLFAFWQSSGSCLFDVWRTDSGTPVLVAASIGIPLNPSLIQTMKYTQYGDTFIVYTGAHPIEIKRAGSDSSWTVNFITFTSPMLHDFGAGLEPVFSNSRGWPRCGCVHQNRLVMGGSSSLPSTLVGSVVGQPYDFTATIPLEDSFAFKFTLGDTIVSHILQLQSFNKALIVNCTAAEWTENSQPLTPSNVNFTRQTPHGMINSGCSAVNVDSTNLFVDRRERLRVFAYNFGNDSFEAPSLSTLTPGFLNQPTSTAYVRGFLNSANLVMFRNIEDPFGNADEENLAVITVDMTQRVQGWSSWKAGPGWGFSTVCSVDDACFVIIHDEDDNTHLGFLTNEVFMDLWKHSTNGSPTTSWTGFTHLAGRTATVINGVGGIETVNVNGSGAFTLDHATDEVWVGVLYEAEIETMPLAPILNGQLRRGYKTRKVHCDVVVRNTADLSVDERYVEFRTMGEGLLDSFPPQFSGTKRVWLRGIGRELTVTLSSTNPWSCIIVAMVVTIKTQAPR